MIYFAFALCFVAILAWDGWRRYIILTDADRNRLLKEYMENTTALFSQIDALSGQVTEVSKRLREINNISVLKNRS